MLGRIDGELVRLGNIASTSPEIGRFYLLSHKIATLKRIICNIFLLLGFSVPTPSYQALQVDKVIEKKKVL